jgi:hypothetical protein
MNVSSQIEQNTSEQFLSPLDMAIDEAKLAKLQIESGDKSDKPGPYKIDSRRLLLVNREIELLEAKLKKVRCQLISKYLLIHQIDLVSADRSGIGHQWLMGENWIDCGSS